MCDRSAPLPVRSRYATRLALRMRNESCATATEMGQFAGMEWGFLNFGLTFWNSGQLLPSVVKQLERVTDLRLHHNDSNL